MTVDVHQTASPLGAHLFPGDPPGNIPLRLGVIGSLFGDFESLTPLRNVNYTDVRCSGLILGGRWGGQPKLL